MSYHERKYENLMKILWSILLKYPFKTRDCTGEIIYEKPSSIFPVHSSDNNSLKELKLIKTGQIQFTGHTQSYPWKRNTEVSASVEKFRDKVHAKRSRHVARTWWTEGWKNQSTHLCPSCFALLCPRSSAGIHYLYTKCCFFSV